MHDEICVIYGGKQMSFSTVYRWFTKFSSGQESVKDAPFSGRLRSVVTKSNINKIKSITEKNARFTVRQLTQMTNLALASVHFILKKTTKVTKISASRIPYLLTDEQKCTRVQMAKQLLKKNSKFQKKIFDSLIAGDETWIYFYEPKQKVDNRIWALKHAKPPSIAKGTLTAKKVLYTIFFRNSGPLMKIAVQKRSGVSGSFYKNVVLKKLQTKIKKSISKNWSPPCPFVTRQCSNAVARFLQPVKVTVLSRPPYSPELALCIFFSLSEVEKAPIW